MHLCLQTIVLQNTMPVGSFSSDHLPRVECRVMWKSSWRLVPHRFAAVRQRRVHPTGADLLYHRPSEGCSSLAPVWPVAERRQQAITWPRRWGACNEKCMGWSDANWVRWSAEYFLSPAGGIYIYVSLRQTEWWTKAIVLPNDLNENEMKRDEGLAVRVDQTASLKWPIPGLTVNFPWPALSWYNVFDINACTSRIIYKLC